MLLAIWDNVGWQDALIVAVIVLVAYLLVMWIAALVVDVSRCAGADPRSVHPEHLPAAGGGLQPAGAARCTSSCGRVTR